MKRLSSFSGKMPRIVSAVLLCVLIHGLAAAQAVTLSADGPGNTYELITSKFAPGNGVNAVESAECATAHPSFGRHVAEVFDATLNKFVFSFYIHVAQDNDRCTAATDRQRVEIKTYESSPANLKGTVGESITYKWLFKIPVGFKPSTSFTHIHQIKPVNGDDGDPLFTLTARKGTGGGANKLELITNNTNKVATPNLSEFEGQWVEATEFITVGAHGVYSMKVRRLSDNAMLINYTNYDILTIRPDNDFIRPKWGIYRSLNTPADLRDDSLQFADFSIAENTVLPLTLNYFKAAANNNIVQLTWQTASEINTNYFSVEKSGDGISFHSIGKLNSTGTTNQTIDYSFPDEQPFIGRNYYRLVQVDRDGKQSISKTELVTFISTRQIRISLYPNPVQSSSVLKLDGIGTTIATAFLINKNGQTVFQVSGNAEILQTYVGKKLAVLPAGAYTIRVVQGKHAASINLLKL